MQWAALILADVPRTVTAAQYDVLRRAFYRKTGMGRDDAALPVLTPPGGRTVPMASPADDAVIPPGANTSGGRWMAPTSIAVPTCTLTTHVPVVHVPAQSTIAGPVPAFDLPAHDVVNTYPQSDPHYAACVATGGVVGQTAATIQAPVTPDWWYPSPFGQSLVTWFPPLVLGIYQYERAVTYSLPAGSKVLVPAPGDGASYDPSWPPGASSSWDNFAGGAGKNFTAHALVAVDSDAILLPAGDRIAPALEQVSVGAATVLAYAGTYSDVASSSNLVDQAIEEVSGNAAIQLLLVAAGTILSAGTATAPLVSMLESGAAGAVADAGGAGGALAQAVTALATHPVVAAAIAEGAAPDKVARALADVAKVSVYADLVPIVGELYDLALDELVIQAQTTRARRDDLRLQLAAIRARVTHEQWFQITKGVIEAVTAIVMAWAIGPADALARVLVQIAEALLSAAAMGLKLANAAAMTDLIAQAMDARYQAEVEALHLSEAQIQASIDALNRALAQGQAAPMTPAQIARAQPLESWWGPIVRWGNRERGR